MLTFRSVPLLPVALAGVLLVVGHAFPLQAQTRGSLVGSVVDEATEAPLEGATITVLNADLNAEVNEEGEFLLPEVPAGEVTVRVEQPGYTSVVEQVEVTAGDVTFLRVSLPRMEALLREILVQAGRRPASGSAETQVRGEDDDGNSETAADLLDERVPGVDITRGTGIVGTGSSVRIRGVSSISLSNSPAIYLDGVRIDEGGSSTAAGKTGLHALETIPASQVERIRILRGPSAAAQYAESANGIILVETRRGDSGDDDGGDDEGR